MGIFELFLLAAGDAMDASAVSMAKGTTTRKVALRHYMSVGLWFGGFQALMTFLGYFAGSRFIHLVQSWDHWISFILLALLGVEFIREAFSKDERKVEQGYSVKSMFILAIATSIDALAVGVSLAFEEVNIWLAGAIIGVVTFLFSVVGLKVGHLFGNKYKSSAEIIGGVVLIFIGVKILLSHLQ